MKKIIVCLFPLLIALAAVNNNETITITGTVKDNKGNPLQAGIRAGSSVATADAAGHYKISVSEKETHLSFSCRVTRYIKCR
jgi:protocatechuate 3,4-dioxygenase beta subunit